MRCYRQLCDICLAAIQIETTIIPLLHTLLSMHAWRMASRQNCATPQDLQTAVPTLSRKHAQCTRLLAGFDSFLLPSRLLWFEVRYTEAQLRLDCCEL